MQKVMVEMTFGDLDKQVLSKLMRKQRAQLSKLLQQGIVANYSIAFDETKIWIVFNSAYNTFEIMEMVTEFPLSNYADTFVQDLCFSEQSSFLTEETSLN